MVKLKERFITNEKGRREAVVLDVRDYEELLEDVEDLQIIAERKKEPSISLDSLKRKLKRNGLI